MKKAVFLDRDGTINIDRNYVYRKEDFLFLPGALEGMRKLQKLGYLLIIITNQSGIARGFYTEDAYKKIETWMLEQLAENGIQIADVYYCPHLPEAAVKKYRVVCKCRKPEIGMFEQAVGEHDIDLSRSIAVGDKMRDLEICKNGRTKGFLLYADQEGIQNGICCIKGGILEAADYIERGGNTYEKVDIRGI